jgi:hypothetical protein
MQSDSRVMLAWRRGGTADLAVRAWQLQRSCQFAGGMCAFIVVKPLSAVGR